MDRSRGDGGAASYHRPAAQFQETMAAAIESSELVKTIDEYVAHLNKEPKPFI